ncbi:MAG: flagellar basal body P-ring protein FlgI, partial [Candidatus Poribacteria bacterium]|nr:flagellar basal body P-ring protein FlgI [Candidatus Poribacteria bacterium]
MKKKMHYLDLKRFVCQLSLLLFLMLVTSLFAVEVQMGDITRIQEINSNQLLGMGIVVGLPGSGDSTRLVLGRQALSNMLSRMEGVRLDPDQLQARNIAAVIVTADLPPFAKSGDRLNVFVSSMGDAKDLNNGTLLFARLQAGDGKVYATAQGRIVVTRPKGQRGGTLPPNGEIVSGGLVVRNLEVSLDDMDSITLRLNHPNYSTSSLIAKKINETFWNGMAEPVDSGTVKVEVPEAYYGGKLVNFIAAISELKIEPNTQATVVV